MSTKTIEIVSRITGPVALCTRKGEQRTVTFQPKPGGVGFALCDEDEAEILLGCIGVPDYWKPGQKDDPQSIPAAISDENTAPEDDETGGSEGEEAGAPEGEGNDASGQDAGLSKEMYDTIKNLTALKALLQTCDNAALIMELVAIEAQKDPSREKWMAALNDRLAAIQQ